MSAAMPPGQFAAPVGELVRRRRSCRRYLDRPLAPAEREALAAALDAAGAGPFGGRPRLGLLAALDGDRSALRGLGTYGFIDRPAAFVAGAIARGPREHEDYGYVLERAVLRATDLGLGTCWLGGSFSKSGFARRFGLRPDELMPAVAAVGHPAAQAFSRDRIRKMAGSDFRKPAAELFFDGTFGAALGPEAAGDYANALELVRLAPSASNRQPWRVVRTASGWHFFLRRTEGYGKGTLLFALLRMADLQRVDIGIAMCHFELGVRERGGRGGWVVEDPGLELPPGGAEYVASWRPAPRSPHGP